MVLKNLWRRKARTLLTAGGITVGIAVVVALLALAEARGPSRRSKSHGAED